MTVLREKLNEDITNPEGLPILVDLDELAARPEIQGIWRGQDALLTGGKVYEVPNLKSANLSLTQSTDADRPTQVLDATLGRNVLNFPSSDSRFLFCASSIWSVAAAWSLVCVFNMVNYTGSRALLGYLGTTPARAGFLLLDAAGPVPSIRLDYGDVSTPTTPAPVNAWNCFIGVHNGARLPRVKLFNGADNPQKIAAAPATVDPTILNFSLGFQSLFLFGKVDLVILANVDIDDGSHDEFRAMLYNYLTARCSAFI